jgi:hypothetical protein
LIAIERFHPMISSNILPNILPKKIISLLSEKSLKKNAGCDLHNVFWTPA